jgi:hypothetical protein
MLLRDFSYRTHDITHDHNMSNQFYSIFKAKVTHLDQSTKLKAPLHQSLKATKQALGRRDSDRYDRSAPIRKLR